MQLQGQENTKVTKLSSLIYRKQQARELTGVSKSVRRRTRSETGKQQDRHGEYLSSNYLASSSIINQMENGMVDGAATLTSAALLNWEDCVVEKKLMGCGSGETRI
jgi:hypothetical protein